MEKYIRYSILKGFFFLSLLLLVSQCGTKEQVKTLKLAHGLPVNHPVSKAMVFLANRCAELSDNKLKVKIYPGGQLGSEQQNVELLQIGSLAMTKVSAAVLEGFAPDYKAIGLPYLFRDKKHYFKVCDSDIGKDLLLSTEKKWIRGLCFYDAGSRSFYTKKKSIKTPDDLKGLKLRVMKSKTAMQMVAALGGSPTPLSWGELYTALQSGVVDGAENNPPTFYSSHHYEVCKYYSLDEHASIPDVLIMSQVVWDKLTSKEQSVLTQAVKESVEVQRKLWAEAENEALVALEKAGVTITHPDKKPFSGKVSQMYEAFKTQPLVYSYIQRIQKLK
ncbi:MAG TPA: TRAP transporter substrate-binding protein [Saprospiraceae bacterium]|nr:TRAP transporter substrate-binding protein [Saprospiraceae bacterium]